MPHKQSVCVNETPFVRRDKRARLCNVLKWKPGASGSTPPYSAFFRTGTLIKGVTEIYDSIAHKIYERLSQRVFARLVFQMSPGKRCNMAKF